MLLTLNLEHNYLFFFSDIKANEPNLVDTKPLNGNNLNCWSSGSGESYFEQTLNKFIYIIYVHGM